MLNIKDDILTIPHNYIFKDACNDGAVIDFFYKNLGLKIPFRGILNNMILSFLYIIPLFIIYIFHFDITLH